MNQKRYIMPIWKLIWKWNGLEHIKVFVWNVPHNSLLMNENWIHRNLTEDPNYHHCQLKIDNVVYILEDCYFFTIAYAMCVAHTQLWWIFVNLYSNMIINLWFYVLLRFLVNLETIYDGILISIYLKYFYLQNKYSKP